ncbi:Gfo/Idh/MocA family oxidoreductase [Salinibacterium sp. ZJ450]|uniref:Gfo/Idh/MocA family protein n=1 Tax=Salinibacterium sp. ZJ450 TaxID=2708338 RepID=UPI0017496BA2|nr:Gfo/Idh/MocA family oxidoreductase [Salinibacterium sp. ZJ450]
MSALTGRPIRAGVIGFGLSGQIFHAPFIAANDDYSLDAIVTANPERAKQASTMYPGARIVATPEELFELDLDLAVIGTPTPTHVELGHAALDAGLALVMDKPMAVTERDAIDLIEKAERLGLPLAPFQNRRWDGDFLTVKELMASGALGTVHTFESRFDRWKPTVAKAWKGEATTAQGGGVLYDIGPHLIDQALHLFGPVAEVHAEISTRRPNGAADDDDFVSLLHESGVRSRLWATAWAAQAGPRFHLLGTESAYTKWGLDSQEPALSAGARPSDPDYGVEPESAWGVLGLDGALQKVPAVRGQYDTFYALLADALLRGAPLPVDPRDSATVIGLIERIHTGNVGGPR